MMLSILIFELFTFISVIISTSLAFYVFIKRRDSYPFLYFSGLMVSTVVYGISYLVEINMPDLASAILCLKIEYIGITFIPVFWLLLACSYNTQNIEKNLRRVKWLHLLFLIPIVSILLVWTNSLHLLVYRDFSLVQEIPLTIIQANHGPFFWFINGFLVTFSLIGTLRMIYNIVHSKGLFRGQFSLLAAAAFLPSLAQGLLLLKKIPHSLDIIPISFALSGLLLFWGMFRIQLFNLLPIARNMVVNAMGDPILVLDLKDRLIESNQSARDHFLGDKSLGYGSPLSKVSELLWNKLSDSSHNGETISSHLNDKNYIFKISRTEINHRVYGTMGFLYILRDITETQSYVKKLEKLASIDGLTGLFNRRHFMKIATMEMCQVERSNGFFSLIIFDLDRFKLVNDSYGHSAGDLVLQVVSRLIQENTREGDLYARYGGEEFILLCRQTTGEQAKASVERLRKGLEETKTYYEKKMIQITASFGISFYMANVGETLETCLRQADAAMYEAKSRGRNQICLYDQSRL